MRRRAAPRGTAIGLVALDEIMMLVVLDVAGLWTVYDRRSEILAGRLSLDARTGKL